MFSTNDDMISPHSSELEKGWARTLSAECGQLVCNFPIHSRFVSQRVMEVMEVMMNYVPALLSHRPSILVMSTIAQMFSYPSLALRQT